MGFGVSLGLEVLGGCDFGNVGFWGCGYWNVIGYACV
jgi:hypothetical protein